MKINPITYHPRTKQTANYRLNSPQNNVERSHKALLYNANPTVAFAGIFNIIKKPKVDTTEIYETLLFDKLKNEKVKAFLSYFPNYHGNENDVLFKLNDQEGFCMGRVKMSFNDWKDHYEHPKNTPIPKPYARLHNLANMQQGQYSGIGSKLIQASIEKSLNTKSQGRMYLYAFNTGVAGTRNDPFGFYLKQKFTLLNTKKFANDLMKYVTNAAEKLEITPEEFIKKIEQNTGKSFDKIHPDTKMLKLYELINKEKKCDIKDIHLDFSEYMFLHDDKVQGFWIPKIRENPVLSKKSR